MKRREKVTEYLRYDFTHSERDENAQVLARKNRSLAEFALKKKQLQADLKKEEDTLNAGIATFARFVTDGYDFRMIDCGVRFNVPRDSMKEIYRLDTFEIVRTERMADDELQRDLPFIEEKKVQKPERFGVCPVCDVNVPMFDGRYGDHGIVSGATGLKDLCAGSNQLFVEKEAEGEAPVNGVPAADTEAVTAEAAQ